ncbi:CBS domain-containing protein [Streptomyces marincola]|uniref:CBS domain-containing protein n=1 Tax=Streptomyces marincola TaxID=2878388 RepID=UPI001CF1A570|nr:CBS domain-containing protein [Streptomyces marincola]UCM87239.1 CBS domain-containing protein [Streptomyces marincola]
MAQTPDEETLLALKGTRITVAELLALFGTRVRNDQSVLIITQCLRDAGLSTLPDFANCNKQTDVHIVALTSVGAAAPEEPDDLDDGLAAGALPQHSFRIGDLPAARGGVESVPPTASLTQATYLMRMKNYSQLPVIEGQSTLRGVVTWSSVARMYETGQAPLLANAWVPDPPVAESHQEFFSQLPQVSAHGYLLVRGTDGGRFTGIVTAADITERFDATAWPFFVIGEIEYRLRKCLGTKLSADAIRAVQEKGAGQPTGQIADLMFGGYVKLLDGDQKSTSLRAAADQNWAALGWGGVDRIQFVHQLDRVRRIRNKIAHFDPEPLSQQLNDELRQFVGLLRQLSP